MKRFFIIIFALLIFIQAPMTTLAAVTDFYDGTNAAATVAGSNTMPDNKILNTSNYNTIKVIKPPQEMNTIDPNIFKTVENPTTLKCALKAGKPINSASYVKNDDCLVNWNGADLKWWFQWDSKSINIASAVWQVSAVEFTTDPSNWQNPDGLVASGTLTSNQKEFCIDFSKFCQTPQAWSREYVKNSAIPYIKNILQKDKVKLLTKANQATFNQLLLKSSNVTALKPSLLAGIKIKETAQEIATNMSATGRKTYYIRVVPLDKQGICVEMPGAQRKIIYGEPSYAPAKDNYLQLKTTLNGCKQSEVDQFTVRNQIDFDWNVSKSSTNFCYFETNAAKVIKNGIVQVSTIPFTSINEDSNWRNPNGLVYQKSLNDSVNVSSVKIDFGVDFAIFAPKMDVKKPIKIPYYVRMVCSDDSNDKNVENIHESNTIKVVYGDMDSGTPIQIYNTVKVPVYKPVIKINEYQPVQFEESKACFQYVVIKQPPGMFGDIYKIGDKVDLSPKPEDKDAWDYIGDGISSAIGFATSLLNWASQAMDSIQNLAADMIVSLVPGQPAWLKSIVVAGIKTGLASLGIPPSLPTSDQLMNMGVDYLAETVAEQTGIPSEIAKQGIQAMADQAKSTGSIQGTMDFLKLDPDFQYRNAYMTLDIYNPDKLNCTLPGSIDVTVKDVTDQFKDKHYSYGEDVYRMVSLAIPALNPGQHLQVPVIFDENNGNKYKGMDSLPVQEAWNPYYGDGISEFKINFYSKLPDINEIGKQLGVSPYLIEFQDIHGSPVTLKHKPNKSFQSLSTVFK